MSRFPRSTVNQILFALMASLAGFGAFATNANAQGKCWDGTIVTDLKDCPKQPGTKLQGQSGGGKATMPQGNLRADDKKSKAVDVFLKMQDIKGESKD